MDKILAQNCVLYNGHNKDMKMESVLNQNFFSVYLVEYFAHFYGTSKVRPKQRRVSLGGRGKGELELERYQRIFAKFSQYSGIYL